MSLNRLFVVGDLHGCYDNLCRQLVSIGFDFKNDLLVSVGDLIDRGKKSPECIELLDKPWFKAVRGNHEQMCIDGLLNPKIKQIHKDDRNGGEWFYKLPEKEQVRIVKLFQDLPPYLEINHKGMLIGFVHANIEQNNWIDFKASFEQLDNDDITFAFSQAIWSRNRFEDRSGKYCQISNIDRVYFGHTVVKNPIVKHNCYFIDTGAYKTGILTILEI